MSGDFADLVEDLELAVELLDRMRSAQEDGLSRSRDWWVQSRRDVQARVERALEQAVSLGLVYDGERTSAPINEAKP